MSRDCHLPSSVADIFAGASEWVHEISSDARNAVTAEDQTLGGQYRYVDGHDVIIRLEKWRVVVLRAHATAIPSDYIQCLRVLLAVRTLEAPTIAHMELIVIDTVQQHLENGFRLHASCRCGRSDWLDLARLVELGYGDVRAAQLGKRLRCRACGRKGLALQCHGPRFPSERERELGRLEAERREKLVPFRRRKPE